MTPTQKQKYDQRKGLKAERYNPSPLLGLMLMAAGQYTGPTFISKRSKQRKFDDAQNMQARMRAHDTGLSPRATERRERFGRA